VYENFPWVSDQEYSETLSKPISFGTRFEISINALGIGSPVLLSTTVPSIIVGSFGGSFLQEKKEQSSTARNRGGRKRSMV